MESRSQQIVAKIVGPILNNFHSEEEKPKASAFPCKRCGGTGWIYFRDNGTDYAARCPDCKLERDTHRFLRKSGITQSNYRRYTLESFRTDNADSYNMKKLAYAFLRDPTARGIGYFGRPGIGKTHICIGICQAMKKEHHYWQYRHEIQRLKATMYKDVDRYDDAIERVSKMPWLYIDDLFKGAIVKGELAKQDRELMFDIINSRYINRVPTIVSSEYSIGEILDADEGIGSRLKEMLSPYIFTCTNGRNRRL